MRAVTSTSSFALRLHSSRLRRRAAVAAALAAAIPLISTETAHATRWWVAANGSWTTSANWSATDGGPGGAGVPTASDIVYIIHTDATNRVITFNGTYSTGGGGDFQIRNGGSGITTFNQASAFNLTCGTFLLGGADGTDILNQSAGTNTFLSNLILGGSSTQAGTYNFSAGTINATSPGGFVPGIYIGYHGTGTFNQTGGTVTTTATAPLNIAEFSGSTGTYILNGAGAVATIGGVAHVGGSNSAVGGSGQLNISAGSMSVANVLKVWNSTGTIVNLSGGALSVGSINTDGNSARFNWTGGQLTIGGDGSSSTFDAAGGGSGALVKTGAGTLTLSGTRSYTGGTTINGGTLQIAADNALGDSSGDITFNGGTLAPNIGVAAIGAGRSIILQAGGATIAPNNVSLVTFAGLISGNGPLIKNGAGGVWLSTGNTFTGPIAVNLGSLTIDSDSALGNVANSVSLDGGGVLLTPISSTITTSRSITIGTGNALIRPLLAASLTLNSGLLGTTGALTMNAQGTLILAAASTRSGTNSITTGTVKLSNGSALGTGAITVGTGGTLEMTGVTGNQPLQLTSTGKLRGTGTSGFNGVTTVASGATVTLATTDSSDVFTIGNGTNDLTGGDASTIINVTGSGTGKVVLAQSSDYTGNWTLSSGTLEIAADNRLGNLANTVTLAGGTLSTIGIFTSARTITPGGTISVVAGALTLSSPLSSGSGVLNKTSAGGLTLQAASTRSGTTTISDGLLRVQNGTALGTGAITVSGAASFGLLGVSVGQPLSLSGSGFLFSASGTSTYTGAITVAAGATPSLSSGIVNQLVIGDGANDLTGGGGGAIMNVTGSGKVTLAQSSNFIGDWALAGKLEIAGDDRLGNTANTVSFNSGTLITAGAMSSARSLTVNAGGGTIDTNWVNSTFSGPITGAGTLTKMSAGTLNVTNIRAGGLSVTGGLLKVTANGSATGVSKTGALSVTSGQLDLTDNKLITTSVPGTASGGIYNGVQGLVQFGLYGDGTTGIITSQPDALTGLTTVGVSTGAMARSLGPTDTDIWAGQTINGNSTMVMYTYTGDANLDGFIDGTDYFFIDSNVNTSADGYANGDFNYDGSIDGTDYFFIDSNIGSQGAPFFATGSAELLAGVAAVPEPAGLSVIGLGATALVGRRRRDR